MTAIENLKLFVDLAQPRLGAEVLSTSDDFFAEKEGLIKPEEPKFIEDKFTDRGKWMDGWESRRRREPGHDYCLIRICRGVIHGVNIDTTHFTGNFPESAMIEACDTATVPDESTDWEVLVPQEVLRGDSHNIFLVSSEKHWNYLRLNIYPDGGVARLRVYGEVFRKWRNVAQDEEVDLAGLENGGVAVACSDMYFGDMWNILSPKDGVNMGDGWETRRRRGEGKDWAIVKLGHPGRVDRIIVDTAHFKGNYPAKCAVRGLMAPGASIDFLTNEELEWNTLLPPTQTHADQKHAFDQEIQDIGDVSHVKLEMYPDGGISRFRVIGRVQTQSAMILTPESLTVKKFQPYGDVIEIENHPSRTINYGYAERYENLADLDLMDQGKPALSIFKTKPVSFPFSITRMERHPRASQAFIPKHDSKFFVVVAEPSDNLSLNNLRLFVTNGRQGINFKRGVWHHFLLTVGSVQEFVVIDRSNPDDNTEEVELEQPYPIISRITEF